MKIKILAIGKLAKNASEQDIIDEYIKRISFEVEIKELTLPNGNLSENEQKKLEADLLLKNSEDYYRIALDENGKEFNSREFADFLSSAQDRGVRKIAFLIGGAFGHHASLLQTADFKWSLSKLTFPHMLARAIMVEQLYRAETILKKHPYHK